MRSIAVKRAIALLGLILVLAAAPAWAQNTGTEVVLSLGRAPAEHPQAKEAALADALAQAVGRVVAGMVDGATLRSRLGDVNGKILANARQFVASMSPQAEVPGPKEFVILVSVTVDKAALDKALTDAGLRLPQARLALTLVLVSDESAPGRPPVYWWSGAQGVGPAPAPVEAVLESLSVDMVNPQTMAGRIPPEARQAVLTEEQALELARMAGAGLVLLGGVRTYPLVTPEDETPPPLVQLEVLDAGTGAVLAMEEAPGPAYHATPGPEAAQEVNQAVEASVRGLLERLAQSAPMAQAAPGEVELSISGVRSLAQLYKFEQVLSSLTSLVEEVKRVSAGAGRADLMLKLRGPSSHLADQLLLQDFGDFLVNVVEATPEGLKLVLIPK